MRLIEAMERFLAEWDAWLCPVSCTPAFTHRTSGLDVARANRLRWTVIKIPYWKGSISYTTVFNLTGNPVVVLPLAQSKEGLPIGVQVVGRALARHGAARHGGATCGSDRAVSVPAGVLRASMVITGGDTMRNRWIMVSIAMSLSSLFILAVSALPNTTQNHQSSWQMVGQIGGPTQAVAVQGNYAYVGVGLRLVVLDVSNPVTPTEVGSTTPFPYFVEDIVVSGTLAYVAAGGAGLRVVNIPTRTTPVEVGAWDSPGYAEGVAVAGNTVYLADGPYGLRDGGCLRPGPPRPGRFRLRHELRLRGGRLWRITPTSPRPGRACWWRTCPTRRIRSRWAPWTRRAMPMALP